VSKGEERINKYLIKNNFKFEREYSFPDCKLRKPLKFDFAVFNNNNSLKCLIEFDGKQHFESVDYFGGEDKLFRSQVRDDIKTNYCLKNNIRLIRIPYTKENKIEKLLEDYLFKNKQIPLYGFWIDNLDSALAEIDDKHEEDDYFYENSQEKLKELAEENLLEYYLYQCQRNGYPVHDEDGYLFYELLYQGGN